MNDSEQQKNRPYHFYAGQPVLGRDCEEKPWTYDFYSHLGEDGRHVCVGFFWPECIPFVGNECLVGKRGEPNPFPFAEFIGKVVVYECGDRGETFIAIFRRYNSKENKMLMNGLFNVTSNILSLDFSRTVMPDEIGGLRVANAVEESLYNELWRK